MACMQLLNFIAHVEDTNVDKFGLVFNDNNAGGHTCIFKLQKPAKV